MLILNAVFALIFGTNQLFLQNLYVLLSLDSLPNCNRGCSSNFSALHSYTGVGISLQDLTGAVLQTLAATAYAPSGSSRPGFSFSQIELLEAFHRTKTVDFPLQVASFQFFSGMLLFPIRRTPAITAFVLRTSTS